MFLPTLLFQLLPLKSAHSKIVRIDGNIELLVFAFVNRCVLALHIGHGHFLHDPVTADLSDALASQRFFELAGLVVVLAPVSDIIVLSNPKNAAGNFRAFVFCGVF